jgi:CheY-like chemotaxis protein
MPKTILVADDSSTIRKIVELTFSGTDIRVESFDSGAAALENLDSLEPDLILADVVMPGPTGYELCKRVKALGAGIPVVLLSSTFEPYDADLAAECGADRHLLKPFESGTLTDTVRELLSPPAAAFNAEDEQEAELSQVDDAIEALLDSDDSADSADSADSEETDEVDEIINAAEAIEEDQADPLEYPVDELDERLVDAVAKAVVRRLSEQVVREIAREVVPDLAERIIRERIRHLESEDS